jgi:hypothetical protein
LDDVFAIGNTFQEHLPNLWSVPTVPRTSPKAQSGKRVNSFRRRFVNLGKVSPEGITTHSKKLKAVREWPIAENTK